MVLCAMKCICCLGYPDAYFVDMSCTWQQQHSRLRPKARRLPLCYHKFPPTKKKISKADQESLIGQHQSTGKSMTLGIGYVLVLNPQYIDDDPTLDIPDFGLFIALKNLAD